MGSRFGEDRSSRRRGAEDSSRTLRRHRGRLVWIFTGFGALLWFLLRVVPKPSRATYPCQKAALPLAGGFLAWIAYLLGATVLVRSGQRYLVRHRLAAALTCLVLAAAVGGIGGLTGGKRAALAQPGTPNAPIGVAQGVHAGRVCWVHDPGATPWEGPGDGYWWEPQNTVQAVVDDMMSRALLGLSGEESEGAAWDAFFRHFNQTRGYGDVGYAPGEKINVKVNFVSFLWSWGHVNPSTYDISDTTWINYPNTSPQMILALLRQLVHVVGVDETDISVGDPLTLFANPYYEYLHGEFPAVRYLDHNGGNAEHPRTPVQPSATPLYWSAGSADSVDYVPSSYAEAKYLINIASLKSHNEAGVTHCAKNHYGSLIRWPRQPGYYDLHPTLAANSPASGQYRALVDLIGHRHLGGKTLLYLVDGLYSCSHPEDPEPRRWDFPPFGGHWTSSLFVSQDALAIDSVCFDFMQEEGDPRQYPQMAGTDDYLHEAALADNPPSGTFYDPDHEGDVERLSSLGVHEHWNNSTDKQYSRNLGTGDGIELVSLGPTTGAERGGRGRREMDGLALTAHPNPFGSQTTIGYTLQSTTAVTVEVLDVRGRRVRELTAEPNQVTGRHQVSWDGKDEAARKVVAGVYYCRVRAGGASETQRLTLIR